jgi:hypothetical protein
VAEFVVVGVSRTELKGDRALGDIKNEFAITAVIVFPAVVFLLQVVIAKGLNRAFEREFGRCRLRLSPAKLVDRQLRCGQVRRLVASER